MAFEWLVVRLRVLNFFTSPLTVNNEYELQNERVATRIFVLVLMLAALVLFIYTAQVTITQTIEVKNPSYEYFQFLSTRYLPTLRCACSNAAIQQNTFITIVPQFHQLCSSIFVMSEWINHVISATTPYVSDDFSYTGGLFFQALAVFCRLANETIMDALETFGSTSFITVEALAKDSFHQQVYEMFSTFHSITELAFYQSFNTIALSYGINMLLPGLFGNFELRLPPVPGTPYTQLDTSSRLYITGTCRCDLTPTCVAPSVLRDQRRNSSDSFFIIEGLFTGCYLVESTRRSTLECFYSASCIAKIEQLLQTSTNFSHPVLPLNALVESQFNVTSNIDQLLARAMVERWEQNISHTQYFAQCRPTTCLYELSTRFNVIYIATTIIAILGGITKVLRLCVLRIVKVIRRRFTGPPIISNESSKLKLFSTNLMYSAYSFNVSK